MTMSPGERHERKTVNSLCGTSDKVALKCFKMKNIIKKNNKNPV